MVNTRSKRGVLLSTGNTPKRVHKRPRQILPVPASRPACSHADPITCNCGSSVPAFFSGKPRTSNPVSEQYLITNLEIDIKQLTLLIGASMEFKNAVKQIIMDNDTHIQAQVDYTQWRVISGTGGILAWKSMAAVLLDEKAAELLLDEKAAEENPDAAELGEWQEVPIHELWDLKTHRGRGWMCYAFIPTLMDILQASSIPGAPEVCRRVMQVDNSEGVRAHLLYCAVKIGVGVLSVRRHDEWDKILNKREQQRMLSRLEALESGGGAVIAGNESRTEQLEQMVRMEIETATAANAEVLRSQFRTEIDTATSTVAKHLEKQIASNAGELNSLRSEIQATTASNTALISTLTHELKGTRDLLSADQMESRRWMQEAVTKIEVSLSGKPAPSIVGDVKQALPLLFLRIRTSNLSHSHPINEDIEDRFFRIYAAGESTLAVARGLLLQFATPFLIAIMGYSGAGKSHTLLSQDGIIAAILGRLRNPIHIHVYEVLTQSNSIADFTYPENSIQMILEGISKARTTAKTPANQTSSRAHVLILFENEAGEPYGIVVDVAGAEESDNRAELDPDMKRTSGMIAIENGHIRSMLVELAVKGKAGFTKGAYVSEVKRASALNMEVGRFLRRFKGEPAVRVLLCLDGARMDLLDRSLTLVPDF